MDRAKAELELQKKLDPANIKPPAPGKYGDYIEGVTAIYEANRIFGHFGWDYTLDGLHMTNATLDSQGKHHIGYFARVTVTVDGVSRGDVGHGQGHGKSEGDAHDSAVKEAVTDALKRALRTFGNPFGLALYDKSRENVGKPEATPAQKRDWVKDNIGRAKNAQELDGFWKRKDIVDLVSTLPEPMQAELQKAYSDQMGRVYQAPEAAE